jgi:hypothetical protein
MRFSIGRVFAAGAVIGLLGVGGAGYAYAQSSTSTPSAPSPSTAPGPHGGGGGYNSANCPNMGGSTNSSSAASGV